MTKKLKSGTPFVYDENDRVVGIRDPHTGTDTDLVTAVTGPGGGIAFDPSVAAAIAALGSGAAISATSFTGVDATGVTDCTDALNAALAALAPGSVVFFPPGTYMAAIRVTVPNTTLTGTWAATIKTPYGATSHVNDACVRILADNCVVESLSLDGNKAGNPLIDDFELGRQSDGVGIYANRATVRNCRIYDTIGHKIIVWNQEFSPTGTAKGARAYFTIEGNHITGLGQRASIDIASTDVTAPLNNNGVIRGNFVDGNMLIVHTAEDLLFEGNVVLSSSGQEGGISVHTNSRRVICRNNIIGPGSLGLATSNGCSEIDFSGNKIYNISGAAISLMNGTNIAANNNLIKTTSGPSAGVQLVTVVNGAVCDNTIISAGGRSVYATTNCENLKIDGNVSVAPGSFHVEVSNTTYATIENNKGTGGTQGIVVNTGINTGLVCSNNDIRGSSSSGIVITTPDAVITNNVVRNAGSHGIRVSGEMSRVVGNEIRDISGWGINLLAAVTGVVITDNRIANASSGGITGLQADTLVRRNVGHITEAFGSATIADGSATAVVTHNVKGAPAAVTLTARGNEAVWVSARTSTTFTISRSGTAGALIVDWQAQI